MPWLALLLSLTLLNAAAVYARGSVIDDSATLPYDTALTLHWEQPAPRAPLNHLMKGTIGVRVRLNVARWLRHAGRVYLVLPAQQPGAITASWQTQGRLLPGRVVSGGRALIYAGPITSPMLEDVLQLTLEVDGRQLRQLYHVTFTFEMEEG